MDRNAMLQEAFMLLDKDMDDVIGKDDLSRVIEPLGLKESAEQMLGDGRDMDLMSFMGLLNKKLWKQSDIEDLQEAFESISSNGLVRVKDLQGIDLTGLDEFVAVKNGEEHFLYRDFLEQLH
ncbi:hypothetical protein CANCADRAFT_43420 [Tortispora caseinolytica NRRL Y-17796]|uniref:EF-hand domain-containing protein n=1 Tax=Tortispora caseinolytica NRRL Y-17796 TaxID=767744 RepID=A0A1E4TM55_9ASCO|nr:hypothetical protein CANCADRAFT_43420 [Tortispora caseinolytica NRRL Y-17796]